MPSPLGHALGGLAAGWLASGRRTPFDRIGVRDALVFAAAGMAPDLDLLVGTHRTAAHSLTAAAVVGFCALAVTRRASYALAVGLAYASHALLDWLGSDGTPPTGIMVFWPFSRDYYYASVPVFLAISRRYWLAEAWLYNLRAVAREILVLLPIAAAAGYVRRRPG
jgi:membrane-bound metal-dependent hydrolase YbcI (DUF457 family)